MSYLDKRGSTLVRLLTALVLVPVVFGLVMVPGLRIGFVLFAALMAAVGLWEYFGLVRALEIKAAPVPGMVFGMALVIAAGWHGKHGVPHPAMLSMRFIFAMGMLSLGVVHLFFDRQTLAGHAASVLGVLYVGGGAAHVVLLHGLAPSLVVFLLVTIILSDTGAYFAGRFFGRHKLAPRVSPKKTWEGAIGGLVAAGLGGVALYFMYFQISRWMLVVYVVMALLIAAFGQFGDLMESMLKRNAGIKDSGSIFPGHGGVLDRCDGILFAAPALYYLVLLPRMLF